MRITMLRRARFHPPEAPDTTIVYKANCAYTVKRDWGDALVAAGDAVEVPVPARAQAPRDPLDHDGDGRKGGFRNPARPAGSRAAGGRPARVKHDADRG